MNKKFEIYGKEYSFESLNSQSTVTRFVAPGTSNKDKSKVLFTEGSSKSIISLKRAKEIIRELRKGL